MSYQRQAEEFQIAFLQHFLSRPSTHQATSTAYNPSQPQTSTHIKTRQPRYNHMDTPLSRERQIVLLLHLRSPMFVHVILYDQDLRRRRIQYWVHSSLCMNTWWTNFLAQLAASVVIPALRLQRRALCDDVSTALATGDILLLVVTEPRDLNPPLVFRALE
jgi:hypothetical protein